LIIPSPRIDFPHAKFEWPLRWPTGWSAGEAARGVRIADTASREDRPCGTLFNFWLDRLGADAPHHPIDGGSCANSPSSSDADTAGHFPGLHSERRRLGAQRALGAKVERRPLAASDADHSV
jgi:hypothetical protein